MEHSQKYCRGDVYFANLDPVAGAEEGGNRPIVIIQNDTGNRFSPTVIEAPITTRIKPYLPTHVGLSTVSELRGASVALLEQIRAIDKSRIGSFICHLNDTDIARIDASLKVSIGLAKKTPNREMLLCLCPTCVNQFYNSSDFIVRRVDPYQLDKDTCTYCDVRKGFDYRIINRKKMFGDKHT